MILKNKKNRSKVGYNIFMRHDSSAHYVVEKHCYRYHVIRVIQMIFFLSFSSVFAEEKADCSETAMTQTAMNICAGSKNLEAAETLQKLLRELVQILPEEPEKNLHKSQEAWSVVVDNDCEIQSWYLDGGSARPMIVAGCYAEHARQRIGLLLPLLCGPMVTTCDAREKYEKNL